MRYSPLQEHWTHTPHWMKKVDAEYWFRYLITLPKWESPCLSVYGRKFNTPRLATFMGEIGVTYTYSGFTHIAENWPEWFLPLLDSVNLFTQCKYNGCLLNFYRDGNDCMGWHADDEVEIDQSSPITSLSFGVKRDFYFKHRISSAKRLLSLGSGDLLVMHPMCQKYWYHSLPKRAKLKEGRVNLTFRMYK